MNRYDLDPIALGENRQGPCAQCGTKTEDAICEDCIEKAERRNDAIMNFYAALPEDLQRAFDTADAVFDSGHEVRYSELRYIITSPDKVNSAEFSLHEAIQWCTGFREVLQ